MKPCTVCRLTIDNVEYFQCLRCKDCYHDTCLNYTESDCLSQEIRLNWLCPNCLSKQPKADNSVPARPSTPTSLANITFSDTRRKVQSRLDSKCQGQPSEFVTRSDIRDIIREEMRSAVKDCIGDINTNLNERLREMNELIIDFKDSLTFLSEQFDRLNSDVNTYNSDMKSLKRENESLRTELGVLSTRLKQMDQMSRATNLELQCIPEHKSENVISIVKQLGRVVKYPINDNDIFYCSRIAKMNAKSSRPRSILVKFSTPRTRDSLLAATITYNKDHSHDKLNSSDLGLGDNKTAVYVVENLTPENKTLHAAARLRAKELNFKFVWVRGGRVYMRKMESSEPVYVRNMDVLNNLP